MFQICSKLRLYEFIKQIMHLIYSIILFTPNKAVNRPCLGAYQSTAGNINKQTDKQRSSTTKDMKKETTVRLGRRGRLGYSHVPYRPYGSELLTGIVLLQKFSHRVKFWAPHWAPGTGGPAPRSWVPRAFGFEGQWGLFSPSPLGLTKLTPLLKGTQFLCNETQG